jgi:hypothetical protein
MKKTYLFESIAGSQVLSVERECTDEEAPRLAAELSLEYLVPLDEIVYAPLIL